MGFGTKIFYCDVPVLRHGVVHEMGHTHDFYHGGLMETVVEVSRSGGLDVDQISHQTGKWLFMDRMNGRTRRKGPIECGPVLVLLRPRRRGLSPLHDRATRSRPGNRVAPWGSRMTNTLLASLGLAQWARHDGHLQELRTEVHAGPCRGSSPCYP